MKQSKKCPKCKSSRIGYFDRGVESKEMPLEAWLCADCGYVELYIPDVGRAPWDKIMSIHWVDPTG